MLQSPPHYHMVDFSGGAVKNDLQGTQSISRAITILRILSERERFGWRLVDLAARCGWSRPTTHRILTVLQRERLVRQREEDRRYQLGPLAFELGLAVSPYMLFQQAAHDTVQGIARRFRTQAIVYTYSGLDTVCAACDGVSPYPSGLEVGTRLPLVCNVGGVAMLAALPPDRCTILVTASEQLARERGLSTMKTLGQMITRARAQGYALNLGKMTRGVNSFGLALFSHQKLFGALAIAGTAEAFPVERTEEVIAAMREAARILEQTAASHGIRGDD